MMKHFLSLFFVSLFFLGGFAQEHKTAIIGFYNLENLFDTIDDPLTSDGSGFLPNGSNNWTSDKYLRKLKNMSYAISQVAKEHGCPTIMGVCEIENELVLNELVAQPDLVKYNYGVVHYDSPDRRGVDVGLLYQKDRFRVLNSKPYRLFIPSDTAFRTRDQLLVTGIIDGIDTISVIVNHWPSKLGGEKRSMPKRIAAAELTKHIVDSILSENANAKVFIIGDMNDNPDAKSIVNYLGAKSKIKNVQPKQLFNPMYQLYMNGIWSYVYRDEPNVIDQIIMTYGVLHPTRGYKYVDVQIFRANFLLNKTGSYEGTPFRTLVAGTYHGGYSDHLPVYVILKY